MLDIGTGTGLLSMIAADAGARRVFTCEGSPSMHAIAKRTLALNGKTGEDCVCVGRVFCAADSTVLNCSWLSLAVVPLSSALVPAHGVTAVCCHSTRLDATMPFKANVVVRTLGCVCVFFGATLFSVLDHAVTDSLRDCFPLP